METVGPRKFVEVPGLSTHELPPLLVRMSPEVRHLDRVMEMANSLIDSEEMMELPADETGQIDYDTRRMDLALNLVEQYLDFRRDWQWGDSILEWIRQCETTFGHRLELRHLLRADLWPHAG